MPSEPSTSITAIGRDFHRVLAAEGISNFGTMLSRLALPWLAALNLQASPLQMAALLLADVAAAALAALSLGAWVDRSGKRRVMLIADGACGALLGVLALAIWLDAVSFALILAVAAASGAFTVSFELARSAWIAQHTATADLPRRNAQLSALGSVSETLAFALGGWLYQALGAAWSLGVDALSYALSALCLRRARETAAAHPSGVPAFSWHAWRQDTLHGLRSVATHATLRALAGVQGLLAFSLALAGTSYMIFVSRELGLPPGHLGMIFALGGLGSLVGAALAPMLGRRFGPGRTLAAGLALFALGTALIPLAQGAGWVAIGLLIAHQIVGDAGHALLDVHDRSLRQSSAPTTLLARADAAIRSVGHAATLAGAAIGGVLGNQFGVRLILWFAVAAAVAAAFLAVGLLAEQRGRHVD